MKLILIQTSRLAFLKLAFTALVSCLTGRSLAINTGDSEIILGTEKTMETAYQEALEFIREQLTDDDDDTIIYIETDDTED